ncbi:hypothetical protein PV10_01158 [Exophiala mesophila]|uniref:CNH domain-containing protein n=1 Tax=Exophiala mesophila TaxID=212818 RepID=A0A0D2AER0_EXOME|nr:uncharacterized protein PV10_01158 [Exophiala mesophila]KIV97403.1 hypothetical protein PV10_01158 [Exophiala mesophila]
MAIGTGSPPTNPRRLSPLEPEPYVLRHVLEDLPLNPDEGDGDASITCVEFWNNNLYVGTSASEILHLVAFPTDESDQNAVPTFILASRLQPSGHVAFNDSSAESTHLGVQKILVLPGPMKACVLCNGTVSFYSLPEFSPAFPNREPAGVQWIGGIDENDDKESPEGPVVMIANARRILQVKVGEKLRPIKNNIEYPGCLSSSRRDTIACVADDTSYALLELEYQQKIPLFPISSQPAVEDPPELNPMATSLSPPPSDAGHSRSTSMGNLIGSPDPRGLDPQREETQTPPNPSASASAAGEPNESQTPSNLPEADSGAPKLRPRASTDTRSASTVPLRLPEKLKPHILSPSPTEFMLTTGTSEKEPGVGMFVNLDGDVVRGTVEFQTYPEDLLLDNFSLPETPASVESDDDGLLIFALLRRHETGNVTRGLEVQRLDNAASSDHPKIWISLPKSALQHPRAGLHHSFGSLSHSFPIASDLLELVPLPSGRSRARIDHDPRTQSAVEQFEQERALFDSQSSSAPTETSAELVTKRASEEKRFASRFGQSFTRNMVFHGKDLFMILRNPLISQLEYRLMQYVPNANLSTIKPTQIFGFLASIHGREPKDESEFLTLNYIRQKASLLLFMHLQTQFASTDLDNILRPIENTLHDGGLDPRIVLLLLPPLSSEVLYGAEGIWLHHGLADLFETFQSKIATFAKAPVEFWMMVRHFLMLWQEKRGYGSIADEKNVFDSTDSALLHVLLHLDQILPQDSGAQRSVKIKLENVVDHWKGDFDRAIQLLESYDRLFVLSRLYQSRKRSRDVLLTWKRIIEGEKDPDYGSNIEFVEARMKKYLTVLRDGGLVQEYSLWLARRNPEIAVQLLTDDTARVKFEPQTIVPLLKQHAPGAVQQYLEHLVFGKHLDKYADDLIGYYLDSVLTVLESSEPARTLLAESYSTYRALETPKPTYLDFINQNPPPDPWWQSRLRLLQLLGSGAYASRGASSKDLTYSVSKVLERMAPFSSFLVSESIILDARQGRHTEALRLLTHGLGDFDTATRYCYFGGPAPSYSQTIDVSMLPPRSLQTELFNFLFREFSMIENLEDRIERTSHLLGTFATFFDPLAILQEIPDDWTVDILSEFLVRSFRAATTERNQAVILKALSAAQNLQKQVEFIEVCEKIGARFDRGRGGELDSGDSIGAGISIS